MGHCQDQSDSAAAIATLSFLRHDRESGLAAEIKWYESCLKATEQIQKYDGNSKPNYIYIYIYIKHKLLTRKSFEIYLYI